MKNRRDSRKKIISPTSAAKKFFRSNKRLVFTNGCFDVLHIGHISYLEQARKKGDFLLVALDTDASVNKLKGRGRPVNSLLDRMRVIAALESVDYVTWFENSDPLPLIQQLRPKALVKGGDWDLNKIRGSKEVLSWGGKVFSLPFVKGHSSTLILKKIQKL